MLCGRRSATGKSDPMHRPTLVVSLCLLGTVLAARAESPFVFGPEEVVPKSVKPGAKWQEGRVQLPAWPSDRNLIPLTLDQGDPGFTYSIDRASLTTGDDEVVRYTLVAESASGARNLSYEGIRCTPNGAFRIYAFGQDGRFEPAVGGDDWQRINAPNSNPARRELWRHYLCVPRLFKPRPKRDQVRMLQSGRVPDIENRGFLTN
jgi:hypothetical protein